MAFQKNNGQVFTPNYLVKIILDFGGYTSSQILQKHIIDNSCGDGAFLTEIVERYCRDFYIISDNKHQLIIELQDYIHGIELDPIAYKSCLQNLDAIALKYELQNVNWDIQNLDALSVNDYDGKMDFVVGNPPYVRVHNLENYEKVKQFRFATKGMVDLFIVFFEVGFHMLSPQGKMCIITPSSWLTSKAGTTLRKYILQVRTMNGIIDLGHYQPFKATTYTLISRFTKAEKVSLIDYNTYNGKTHFIEHLSYEEINFHDGFYFATHKALQTLHTIKQSVFSKRVYVKNGFATLADKIFIGNHEFKEGTIDIIKASTGKWARCIFPYDKNCKPLSLEYIQEQYPAIYNHLERNKASLLKRDSDSSYWYLFGRTQALNDVYRDKVAINTIIKDLNSIKLNLVKQGQGVYSGLYILTDVDYELIKQIVVSDEFIEYIKLLKKYKSGGYYTFSSKELELFLNYKLTNRDDGQRRISDGYIPFV